MIDTPGFADSDGDENELLDEMTTVLNNVVEGANGIVLLLNGAQERFDASLQQMLREMTALFGDTFWSHTIIGVSHWAYDSNSVAQRNYTGKTEERFMRDWNELLSQKFHLEITLFYRLLGKAAMESWRC